MKTLFACVQMSACNQYVLISFLLNIFEEFLLVMLCELLHLMESCAFPPLSCSNAVQVDFLVFLHTCIPRPNFIWSCSVIILNIGCTHFSVSEVFYLLCSQIKS